MMRFIRNIIFWPKRKNILQKPDLILHIGTEKTGTTTIQEFLHLNRKLLAKHGVYFPKSIGMRNHRPLATWCLSEKRNDTFLQMNQLTEPRKRKQWKREFIHGFEAELSGLSSEIKQVIFSSEHFSSLLNHPAEIETLKQFLDQWFTNIRVLVYLRRQDFLFLSRFSTACRAGKVIEPLMPNPANLSFFYDYQKLLSKWSRIFGKENIHPALFDKTMLYNNDLLSDFIHRCGLPANLNFVIPENKNESLSETAQEVAQLFNHKFPAGSTDITIKELQKIRKELIETVNNKYPGPGKKPLRQEAETFYKQFEESNNRVARRWFGREKLFSEDFSMYPESRPVDKIVPDYQQILNEQIQMNEDVFRGL